jgi:hypothetical protein
MRLLKLLQVLQVLRLPHLQTLLLPSNPALLRSVKTPRLVRGVLLGVDLWGTPRLTD